MTFGGQFIAPRITISASEPAVEGDYPTNETLDTDHDSIPNLALNATILSVDDGNWSDTATWDLGRIPTDGDIVGIQNPHTVTYDVNSTARIDAVGVAGTLSVKRDATTKLMVQHLIVYGADAEHGGYQGYLDWGTVASPVQSSYTAQIVGLSEAIDTGTASSLGTDPEQYGNGLICFGKIRMCGQTKTPFIRLADEPAATDTVLTLSGSVTGWNNGDTVVLPESRQYYNDISFSSTQHRWESRTISNLSGTALTLSSALTWGHPAAYEEDGLTIATSVLLSEDLYPHVANVTRNVSVSSEDGEAVRWHSLFTYRADVDIRNSEWVAMGRTTNGGIHVTILEEAITGLTNASPIVVTQTYYPASPARQVYTGDSIFIEGATGNTAANGLWTVTRINEYQFSLDTSVGNGTYPGTGATMNRIGTQQKGRYAVHFHHLYGPVGGQGDGRAFKFIGNAVHDPLPAPGGAMIPDSKWFITIHGSSYGTIQNNVIHHAAGAGLMTEEGSEYENIIDGNIVMNVIGDVSQRSGTADGVLENTGRSGIGFMFTGFKHRVTNNVACGCVGTYLEIVGGTGFYWNSRAAGMSVTLPDFVGADPSVDGTTVDMTYQPLLEVSTNEAYGGIAAWGTIWHLGTSGYNSPVQTESTIENLVCWNPREEGFFGYPTNKLTFDGYEVVAAGSAANSPYGITWGDYRAVDTTVRNVYIRGVTYGLAGPSNVSGTFTFEDGEVSAFYACVVMNSPSVPGVASPELLDDHELIVDNILCEQYGAEAGYYDISKNYTLGQASTNLRKIDRMRVLNHNQVLGDDFLVYYVEQDEDFTMPQTGGNISQGCPVAGLTNAQAYVAYNQDGTAKSGGSLSDPTGCCIGGEIAFNADVTTRAGIDGLIEEI